MSRLIVAALVAFILPSPASAWESGAGYPELSDRLDRPEDVYCLDVAGSGDWVHFTVPLSMHNCKAPGFYADEAVVFDRSAGPITFPAYRGCVTAIGRDGRSPAKNCLDTKTVRRERRRHGDSLFYKKTADIHAT